MGNPSNEQRAASKVKMSGSEKMKANRNTSNRRAKQPQINVQKSVLHVRISYFFLVIRFIDFVAVLTAFAV